MSLAMPASRSLIALLVGTVVFFALWIVALKPGSSTSGGSSSSQGLGAYQSDINKAKQAVGTSNDNNAASGNENSAGSSVTPAASSSSGASTTSGAKPASHSSTKPAATSTATKAAPQPATAAQNLSTVKAGISAHKVVVMLFYNPSAADDLAVKQGLGSVPTHRGQVVKLAIPVSQAGSFTAVTQQVPVNFTPTLVLIDPSGQASEIVGYSDTFEIDQRVADALAAR
jgi:hypothetical protein